MGCDVDARWGFVCWLRKEDENELSSCVARCITLGTKSVAMKGQRMCDQEGKV